MIRRINSLSIIILFVFGINACEKKEIVQNTTNEMIFVVEDDSQIIEDKAVHFDEDLVGRKNTKRKDLQEYDITGLYPLGDFFWDEFGEFQEQYPLSTTESEMLGTWIALDDVRVTIKFTGYYYFYPNKLFMIEYNSRYYTFVEEEDRRLYMAFGIWYIENGIVKARIYSFMKGTYKGERIREFFTVTPYEIEIIDTRFIDSAGFSTKHFSNFVFSPELEGKIRISDDANITYRMARSIFIRNPLVGIGRDELKKEYRFFDIMPDLARNNLSGIDIVTDLELLEKYFHERKN